VVFAVFFFQAEDGIRDATVTGVQTCALPICQKKMAFRWQAAALMRSALALGDTSSWKISSTQVVAGGLFVDDAVLHHMHEVAQRSEERRVGKEWRDRGGRASDKKGSEIGAV